MRSSGRERVRRKEEVVNKRVNVCVYVYVRERERERKGDVEREAHTHLPLVRVAEAIIWNNSSPLSTCFASSASC